MAGSLFITGATGFIGKRLLPKWSGNNVCLSRRPGPGLIQGDLLDSASYAPRLAGCDTVLHMAAVTGKAHPGEYFRINREGTKALVGESRRAGVKRFIYISTIAAKFQDQSRYYYAQAKRQAEEIVERSGLRYTIVRPTMVFGDGAPVLAGLTRLAMAPVIPIFGNGRALVQPVFVDDLATCLAEVLQDGFEEPMVEIGGPQVLSIEDLLLRIRRTQNGPAARTVHLPAGLLSVCLGLVEKVALGAVPFTAGQMASFTNDGTAAATPRLKGWQARMQNLDQMLSLSRA